MAIGDETFDDWATETTQNELKKLLESKLKGYDAKKIEDLLKKIEENTKSLKKGKGAGGVDFTQALKSANLGGGSAGGGGAGGGGAGGATPAVIATLSEGFSRATGGTPGGGGGGGGPVPIEDAKEEEVSATKKAASGLLNFGLVLGKNTVGMITAGAVLGALGSYVGKSIDSYRELIGVGQSFSGSMLEMRRQAAEAGMGFSDFTNIMSANSAIVKAVGNTSFIALQKRVREVNSDFGHFGFTVAEGGQIVADYAERQLRAGRLGQLTTEQQALETQKYMYQLTELSKITGRNRKEMAKEMQEISRDVDIFTAQALLGAEGGKKFREGLERAGPAMTAVPGFGKALTNAAAMAIQFGNQGMSAFGQVSSIVSGKLSTGMENWVSALKRGESGNEHLATVFGELGDMSGDTVKSVALMARAGDEGAKSMMGLIQNFTTMSDEQKSNLAKQLRMTDAELANKIATSKAALNKEQEFTRKMLAARSKWDETMGQVQLAVLEKLGPTLVTLSEQIGPLVDKWLPRFITVTKMVINNLEWFVGAWAAFKTAGIIATLIGWGSTVVSFVAGSTFLMGILTTIGTGIAAAFGALTLPIWAVVAAVVGAVGGVVYFWDEIKAFGSKISGWVSEIWKSITDSLTSLFDFDLAGMFSDLFDSINPFSSGKSKKEKTAKRLTPAEEKAWLEVVAIRKAAEEKATQLAHEAKIAQIKRDTEMTKLSYEKLKAMNPFSGIMDFFSGGGDAGSATSPAAKAAQGQKAAAPDVVADRTEVMGKILEAIKETNAVAMEQVNQTKKLGRNPNVGLSMTN